MWWTSDTHFGHRNVIRFCDRPYSSVEEMDEAIIEEWNSKVGPNDTVYHLGDFSFYRKVDVAISLLEKLNGNIFFIKGNHDSNQFLKKAITMDKVLGVRDIYSVKIDDSDAPHGKQRIVMCHYAMEIWDRAHYGAWHLFGHCVDLETEILTRNGWKFRNQLLESDLVLGYNHALELSQWVNIDEIIDTIYTGLVYIDDSIRGANYRVTANHRIPRFSRDGKQMYYDIAEVFHERNRSTIMKSGIVESVGIELSDLLIKLYIFIAADGSIKNETNLCRIRVKKEYKKIYVLALLDGLNIDYRIKPQKDDSVSYNFTIPDSLLEYNIKGLDDKLIECSIHQFEVILKAYVASDGCRSGNSIMIYSNKECEIDLLQRLAIQSGYSAKKYSRIHGIAETLGHQLCVTKKQFVNIRHSSCIVEHVEEEHFWCIQNELSNFFIRRRGVVHLTGNSHGTLPDNLDKMRLDVGLDNNDMKMLSYEDIKVAMFRRGYKSVDHHNSGVVK